MVGLDRFGESAPAGLLFKHFGITPEAARAVLAEKLEAKIGLITARKD